MWPKHNKTGSGKDQPMKISQPDVASDEDPHDELLLPFHNPEERRDSLSRHVAAFCLLYWLMQT